VNCKKTRARLNAYCDGELTASQTGEVRRHLNTCPACAGEFAQLKSLNHALEALEGMAAPAGFARRVRAAAEAGNLPAGHIIPVRAWRFSPVLARAAAILMVLAGLWSGITVGHSAFGSIPALNGTETSELSELELQIDPLSATPLGSVEATYLELLGAV